MPDRQLKYTKGRISDIIELMAYKKMGHVSETLFVFLKELGRMFIAPSRIFTLQLFPFRN